MQGERVTVQGERVTGEWYANYFDPENITILGFQPKRNLVCLSICVTSLVSFYVQNICHTQKIIYLLFPKAYLKNHGLIFVLFHVFSMFTSLFFGQIFATPPNDIRFMVRGGHLDSPRGSLMAVQASYKHRQNIDAFYIYIYMYIYTYVYI